MTFIKGQYYPRKNKNFKYSEESKLKMRLSHLGKKLPEEQKRKIGLSSRGRIVSEETRRKISEANKGPNSPSWTGDKVSYSGLHKWIVKYYGKADHCEICGTEKAKAYDWSNISGEYKRDRKDWEMLCRRCHMIKDGRIEKCKKFILTIGYGRSI